MENCVCKEYPYTIGFLFSYNHLWTDYERWLHEVELNGCRLKDHELAVYLMDHETAQNYGWYYLAEVAGVLNTASNHIVNFYNEYEEIDSSVESYKKLLKYVKDHDGLVIFLGEPNTDDLKECVRLCRGHDLNFEIVS